MKKVVYGLYSAEGDITFVMEDVYNEEGFQVSQKVVGFYYGKPEEEFIREYAGKPYIHFDEPNLKFDMSVYPEGSYVETI